MKKCICLVLCIVVASSCFSVHSLAYKGEKAAEYASEYWEKPNRGYPYYSLNCTNFVSQCVENGMEPTKAVPSKKIKLSHFRNNVYKCTDYWSCRYYKYKVGGVVVAKGYVASSTWTSVDEVATSKFYGFQDFMKIKRKKTVTEYGISSDKALKTLVSRAKVGDVVQYKETMSGRYTHSLLVGRKSYNKEKKKMDIYFYGNTGNRGAREEDSLYKMREKRNLSKNGVLALISMD